jgi:L-proline amide hydrolase
MELWMAEAGRLPAALAEEVRAALEQHEAAGSTDDAAYVAATQAYHDRHLCRVVPSPPQVRPSSSCSPRT